MRPQLATSYLGLPLAGPLIASASPLTGRVETLLELEAAGAAAVVLPSLFEEEVLAEEGKLDELLDAGEDFAEFSGAPLPDIEQPELGAGRHLKLVEQAKERLRIPVIASLNATRPGSWQRYAAQLAAAGADALELNLYSVATDPRRSAADVELEHLAAIEAVRIAVDIPLAVKLSPFYSALSRFASLAVDAGAVPDDEARLEAAMRGALADADMLVLSGGTSKGAGDLSHRIIGRLGAPGIVAHGVALKPGKPLCLAVCDGKPVVILPGFPTSAMFTFHDMIVPVLRRMAGLPPRSDAKVSATVPVRIASELGRTEFVMVSLVEGWDGLIAYPSGKGSGAITSFAQADGFLRIDALADQMPAGTVTEVTLFTPHVRVPELVIVGSHCTGLDLVTAQLAHAGLTVRTIAIGSLGGLAAAKRGERDLAPIHLFDDRSETYNAPYLVEGLELVSGWRRMQGIVFRKGDKRFEHLGAKDAVAAALADPACIMVNRNQGAGTRILIDRLLGGARPEGYWNQPRSHNAVAAAVAQHRADWGMTIAPVAHAAGLGFIPLAEEHYDFALVTARKDRSAVRAFLDALGSDAARAALERAGFRPA